MSLRYALILAALLVVLGGGTLVYQQYERSRQPSNVNMLGQPLLKGLNAAEIAAIRIAGPQAALTLARKDDRWTIAERGGFPADFGKVRGFVLKAVELKIGQSEPIGENDRARLALVEPGQGDGAGTLIEFRSAEEKPLARVIVGAKYFKQVPDSPDRAPGDGRFVMLPANAKTVYVVGDPLGEATTKSSEWVDATGIAAERVKSIEYRAGGERWKVEKRADHSDWKLVGAGAAEKLDLTKPNSAAYMLGRLAIADVAPGDATPDRTGLDQPTATVVATTFDGLTYTLRLGKREGDDYYAKIAIDGALVKTRAPAPGEKPADQARLDKEFAERIAKLEARLPREQALADYTLVIAKRQLDDLLKKRAELLEQQKK